MDGVTDSLMRELLTAECPFSYCVTEFIRVSKQIPPAQLFLRDVPEIASGCRTSAGVAVQVQLLGGDPDAMALSAQRAVALGALGVDINFGCPAPTVNRHDGGATLLKFPERIEAIVSAVRSAVPSKYPVSAKLRLGWDDPRSIITNAERAARGGASWITIHGRTKMQGYTPPAYWKPIGEVRRNLSIPVVANGEIWSLEDLKRCEDESHCRHFMLGRAALARPSVVAECARYLGISVRHGLQPHPAALNCAQEGSLSLAALWPERLERVISASMACGEGPRKTLSRLKQWLNYAHKYEQRSVLMGSAVNDLQLESRVGSALFEQIKRASDLSTVRAIVQSASAGSIDYLQADAA
jgi:tRNA-dihydrouridine synthase C